MEIAYYNKIICELRYEWEDKIPKEQKTSNSKPNNFKCRNNWFTLIVNWATIGKNENLLSIQAITIFENFKKHIINNQFTERNKTKEDIQLGNQLLDTIISNLNTIIKKNQN